MLFFCSFTKLCVRSQKWDRQAVPFLGPCLGSFFEVFCIRVAEAQSFGFNETLWILCLLQGSAFAVDFAILRSHFWYPPDGPKNGTVKVLFFCSFTKLCMRSQKMGPPGGPIFGTMFRFIF